MTNIKSDMLKIRENMKSQMQALFNNYTFLYGNIIGKMFNEYLQNIDWLNIAEPRDVNPQILSIITKQISLIDQEMGLLFDKKSGSKAKKPIPRAKKGVFQMEHEMERLLAKKVKIFANVECKRPDIMIGFMRIALKSFYEEIRNLHIAKFGFQQLQIDLNFIETVLREIYNLDDETGILSGLFKEALHSAKLRCLEPQEIDETIIDTITEVKLKKISTQ